MQQLNERTSERPLPTNRKSYYHESRNHYVNNLGGDCLICDSPLFLHIHHENAAPMRQNRGGHDNMISWKREFMKEEDCCLILLCKQCHKLLHLIKKLGSEKYFRKN